MRQKFIECETYEEALNECPWAEDFAKVTDGYMCFESNADYIVWNNQK